MKINSLFISSFGAIKNLKLDFSNGFNVIYGDNENGKTTVMAFIKMMFYGSERGGSTLSKNIRKKYTPWDGSAMAGSIDFTLNGKKYRLEKEFRSSNSTDKTTLFDLDLSESKATPSDVGTAIFGLSAAAFERSVFIGQFGFPESDKEAEGELSGKLSNLTLTGDENVSFEAVSGHLQKAKLQLMSKSGKAGEYDKNVKLLSDLELEIKKGELAKQEYSSKKAKAEILQNEIVLLQKNSDELRIKIEQEQEILNYGKYKKLLELKGRLDKTSENLRLPDGGIIDDIYLGKIKFCLSKAENAINLKNSKQNEISLLEQSIKAGLNPPEDATAENAKSLEKEIEAGEKKLSEANLTLKEKAERISEFENGLPELKKRKKAVNLPIILTSVILCALGAVFAFINPIVTYVTIGAGVLALILAFVIRPIDKKLIEERMLEIQALMLEYSEQEKIISQLTQELNFKKDKLHAINTALSTTASVLEKQENILKGLRTELTEADIKATQKTDELLELFSKYREVESLEAVVTALPEIAVLTDEIKSIKTELAVYIKELGGISYETAKEKLGALEGKNLESNIDFKALKEEYSRQITEIGDKKAELVSLVSEAKALRTQIELLEKNRSRREILEKKVKAQKEYCDILDIALLTLSESFSEVHSSYGAVLEKEAAQIFSKLTNGKYESMSISKGFDISVREKEVFGTREVGFLSSGTVDQSYLSLRLALAKLICDSNEKLPIFLDDSLAQYDDSRTENAIAFLKEYAESEQVIMFTCHRSISDLAEKTGANIYNL